MAAAALCAAQPYLSFSLSCVMFNKVGVRNTHVVWCVEYLVALLFLAPTPGFAEKGRPEAHGSLWILKLGTAYPPLCMVVDWRVASWVRLGVGEDAAASSES